VTETVRYSFKANDADGKYPDADLTYVNGTLYGTTPFGGAHGVGSVFKVTTSGTESVLYSFASGSDGAYPEASLTNVHGTLYGTTHKGGAHNRGTVYSLSGF
jgi:uncharacterized repeat protein (TIGR03803 family)